MGLFPFNTSWESEQDGRINNSTAVNLNIYDITQVNDYFYMFGIGVFHSGIEVHGTEYAFGAHDDPTSGVFEVEPKRCPGYIFRRSVFLGSTDMSRSEFHSFMESLASKYHGDTYHLIAKNCNHFTDEVCQQLTGRPIPAWVNRLARVGSFCNCLLPESLQVGHVPEQLTYSDDERSDSDGLSSSVESEDDDDEEADQYLLRAPNIGDVAFVKEQPIRLARELL